jgi:hypothetical protein
MAIRDRETRRWFQDHDLDMTGLSQEDADEIREYWSARRSRIMTKAEKESEEHAQ